MKSRRTQKTQNLPAYIKACEMSGSVVNSVAKVYYQAHMANIDSNDDDDDDDYSFDIYSRYSYEFF